MSDMHLTAKTKPLLLDGGNGRELLRRRVPILTHTWAPVALYLAPEIVQEVHEDFIAAGADIITTNTYGLNLPRMERDGIAHRFAELNHTAARLAQQARDAQGRDVAIAASLPPSAERAFQPGLVESFDTILPRYRLQVELLAPHVDLFLCETMTSGPEALAAATAACETGKPVWVSWTLDDERPGHLRSGETLAEATALLADQPVAGLLVNCCLPERVQAALPALEQAGTPRFGAYANALVPLESTTPGYGERSLDPNDWEQYEAAAWRARDDMSTNTYLSHARHWLHAGASIVGGCCGCGPAYIAGLRQLIDEIDE